jgi:hypothetical protein
MAVQFRVVMRISQRVNDFTIQLGVGWGMERHRENRFSIRASCAELSGTKGVL